MKSLARSINKYLYYGWVIVFISAVSLFFSAPGQTYSISVFKNIYQEEFNVSSSMMSLGYTLATILSGSLLVIIGKFVDRYGQRIMMMIVGILLALTTFYHSFVINVAMIFSGFFFLRFFGQGSLTLIPHSLVPQWFEKKRALALSLETFGALIATMSVPAFNYWLITQIGWQNAWRVWGIGLLIVFVPLTYIFVINKPSEIGLTIDNGTIKNDEDAKKDAQKLTAESFTLKEALQTKEFWMIGLMSTVVPLFSTGITFHFFDMMALRNVSNAHASFIIGLVAFPAFFMPFAARLLIDRYPMKYIFFGALVMIFIAMVWLAFFVNGAISAAAFILFYGVAVAVKIVTLNTIWPTYFGRKYLGAIRGATTVFMVLSTALGPLPLGIVYDLTGSFNIAIYIMMGHALIAMVFALSIRRPNKVQAN